jgi:hypothetical protein
MILTNLIYTQKTFIKEQKIYLLIYPTTDQSIQGLVLWFHNRKYIYMTASVVLSEFLTTDPEVLLRFPALSDVLRSRGSGMGL